MKKIIIMILSIICILAFVSGLTACTTPNNSNGKESRKAAVCYVIANTANSQGLNMSSPLVQDTVYATIRNYGYISVVNADGVPEVVLANSFDIDDKYKSASKDKLDMDARAKATNFIASMQSVVANDPEVEYLESLKLAVRSLSSLEGYDSKSIIVLGTGLSTVGNNLNFCNNLLSADPDVIVDMLKEKSEIPNFSDITVYWQQMADVAAPQEALTSAQKKKLQQIYSNIIEAGGGTFVYNEIMANPVNESVEYPKVTPVEIPADTPISFEPEVFKTSEAENIFNDPWVLPEKMVSFIGDKAEYLQPDQVVDILKPIAEYLTNNQVTILLCGTTAGDEDSNYTMALSKNRAETVKRTLVELGIDEERIIAVGLGSSDPWHVYGISTSDKASSVNRKVVLLDATSEMALSILEKLNS